MFVCLSYACTVPGEVGVKLHAERKLYRSGFFCDINLCSSMYLEVAGFLMQAMQKLR